MIAHRYHTPSDSPIFITPRIYFSKVSLHHNHLDKPSPSPQSPLRTHTRSSSFYLHLCAILQARGARSLLSLSLSWGPVRVQISPLSFSLSLSPTSAAARFDQRRARARQSLSLARASECHFPHCSGHRFSRCCVAPKRKRR